MLKFAVLLAVSVLVVFAQGQETGRLERRGGQMVLTVEGPRPVDLAAQTLAKEFDLRINVEDPFYLYEGDAVDVPAALRKRLNPAYRVMSPKGGHLEVRFPVADDGSPVAVPAVVQSLREEANRRLSFAYRLDVDGDRFTLVPTRTHDQLGNLVPVVPLLDRQITIPTGTRTVMESAGLMAEELSKQTGLTVSCCQSMIAGIPWGLQKAEFGAAREPARRVLQRLIALSLEGREDRYYWLARCDALPSRWCFIDLHYVPSRATDPPNPAPEAQSDGRNPWFDKAPKR